MPGGLHALNPAQLAQRRNMTLRQFSRIEGEFDCRRQGNRLLAKGTDVHWESASAVHPTQQEGHRLARIISPELGFNIYTLQVSLRMVPTHYQDSTCHSHGESVRYCLSGMGRQTVEDTRLEIETGDLVFVPSGTRHCLANPDDAPLLLLVTEQMPGTYLQIPAPWRDPG